jgi:hypothetical protein
MIRTDMRSRANKFVGLAYIALITLALPLDASESFDRTCIEAAKSASVATGVPIEILVALTLTETGRSLDGQLTAWPWSLNEAGTSHWFDSRAAALDYLAAAIDGGATNIDIGCFQLNHRWHSAAFQSLEAMMDPERNALYAAQLVKDHMDRTGDWIAAAGAFHSRTPDVAARYLDRFVAIYERIPTDTAKVDGLTHDRPKKNLFPLLQGGVPHSAGSLVPRVDSNGPLFGES